eukprot:4004424-Amphidinium_carterae.1
MNSSRAYSRSEGEGLLRKAILYEPVWTCDAHTRSSQITSEMFRSARLPSSQNATGSEHGKVESKKTSHGLARFKFNTAGMNDRSGTSKHSSGRELNLMGKHWIKMSGIGSSSRYPPPNFGGGILSHFVGCGLQLARCGRERWRSVT